MAVYCLLTTLLRADCVAIVFHADAQFSLQMAVYCLLTLLLAGPRSWDVDSVQHGRTPLQIALTHKKFELVKLLLQLGAKPEWNAQTRQTGLVRVGAEGGWGVVQSVCRK